MLGGSKATEGKKTVLIMAPVTEAGLVSSSGRNELTAPV